MLDSTSGTSAARAARASGIRWAETARVAAVGACLQSAAVRSLVFIVAGSLLAPLPQARAEAARTAVETQPGFDCARARAPVEHWICADAGLAHADRQMSASYQALRQRWEEDGSLVRQQRRWLRARNACPDADCVATAYAARNAALQQALAHVPDLGLFDWASLPEGSAFRIDHINDTRALGVRIPAAARPRTLQWEFYPDPGDHVHRFTDGPLTEIVCRPPDAREGYAARFGFQQRKAGPAIAPIRRGTQTGYRLMRMTLGTDLPLHEDIRCTFVFGSWLLDKPSMLYLVPVATTAAPAAR